MDTHGPEINKSQHAKLLSHIYIYTHTKPNNTPLYVHHNSNHRPTIIRNIPLAINRRLNGISSTREAFERATPEYQRALNKSRYTQQLQYQTGQIADDQPRTKPPARHRKITWYNPPYSQNVATNVGRKFLNIAKESFKEGHPLNYSCMPKLASKFTSHNKSALEKTIQSTEKLCNCRTQSKCPLNGKCLTTNVVYQATVESDRNTDTYIGLTADTFKTRYNNHTASFRTETKRNATELSKHIWALQDRKLTYKLTWKIVAHATPYSNTTKRCNLCLTKKYFILCKPQTCTLNRRNELASACRHTRKFLLKHV